MAFSLKIDDQTLKVDLSTLPDHEVGLAGSILNILTHFKVRIQHSCGGIGACTTCHVYVKTGLTSCNPVTVVERARLPELIGQQANSRLACQCVPEGSQDLEVEIP